jgi:hypothetical protein
VQSIHQHAGTQTQRVQNAHPQSIVVGKKFQELLACELLEYCIPCERDGGVTNGTNEDPHLTDKIAGTGRANQRAACVRLPSSLLK